MKVLPLHGVEGKPKDSDKTGCEMLMKAKKELYANLVSRRKKRCTINESAEYALSIRKTLLARASRSERGHLHG